VPILARLQIKVNYISIRQAIKLNSNKKSYPTIFFTLLKYKKKMNKFYIFGSYLFPDTPAKSPITQERSQRIQGLQPLTDPPPRPPGPPQHREECSQAQRSQCPQYHLKNKKL
jgi:hypothetical protein